MSRSGDSSEHRYISVKLSTHVEELSLRQYIASAMTQMFGITRALTYVDVLAINKSRSVSGGYDAFIRVPKA